MILQKLSKKIICNKCNECNMQCLLATMAIKEDDFKKLSKKIKAIGGD
jgi:hypothetical protein